MGFWDGFGEGFAGGYQQSFDAAERRKLFMEETQNKKKAAMAPLKNRALESLATVEEQRAMLSYLKNRGMTDNNLNGMYEDPDRLKDAYEFAREKSADADADTLNSIFSISQIGDKPPENAFDLLNQAQAAYMDMISGAADPDTWVDPAVAPRTRTSVVETRMPKTEDELGISAVRDRTWNRQAEAYEQAIMTMANTEVNTLNAKKDSGSLSPDEFTRLTQLQEWTANFDKDGLANQRLRDMFGEQARSALLSNPNNTPEFLAFFEKNPMIQDLGAEARQAAEQRRAVISQGTFIGEGVDPQDGRYTRFYKMPDGTTQPIKD
jgi:hypothetical protein